MKLALAAKPQGINRLALAKDTQIAEGFLSRTLAELVECDFISIDNTLLKKKGCYL